MQDIQDVLRNFPGTRAQLLELLAQPQAMMISMLRNQLQLHSAIARRAAQVRIRSLLKGLGYA